MLRGFLSIVSFLLFFFFLYIFFLIDLGSLVGSGYNVILKNNCLFLEVKDHLVVIVRKSDHVPR